LNYHKKPETEEEYQELGDMNYQQGLEAIKTEKITCICGSPYDVFYMFRCYYCGLWLCPACAREHFGERPKGRF